MAHKINWDNLKTTEAISKKLNRDSRMEDYGTFSVEGSIQDILALKKQIDAHHALRNRRQYDIGNIDIIVKDECHFTAKAQGLKDGYGESVEEAIGILLVLNRKELGIEITKES